MDDVSKPLENAAEPPDAELVARVLAGRPEAFGQLVQRHQRQAMSVSYRLLGSSHDAAEVTQDAFLKAYNSLATLQQPAAFKGWLLRIVSNLSLNKRRGRKRNVGLPADDLLDRSGEGGATGAWTAKGHDPHRQLESRELGQRVQAALEQLSEKQRLALTLFTMEELPQKEVAEALECSVEAVKWHVFQARKRLKELLKDDLIEQ
jgi:RNA polymerase sigma-70 factor (ECF subfamily)